MFISTAWAQAAGGGSDAFLSLMPIVLIFAVFYFLIIRPQQKKHKQHKEAVAAVRRGDRIVTGGGIVATVVRVEEGSDEIVVEIAEGIRVRVKKNTLMDIQAKGVPANDSSKK